MTDGTKRPLDASTKLAVERTYLAHERTLMAWVRISISLIGFGFSIQQFFQLARVSARPDNRLIGPNEFGFLMMAIGLVAQLIAAIQHRSDLSLIERRYPPDARAEPLVPRSRAGALALLVGALGLVAFVSMIARK